MTPYTLNFTRKADKDESDIYKYITDKFGEIYAKRFRRNLIEFCHLLTQQPFIGRPAKNNETLRVFIFSKRNKIEAYLIYFPAIIFSCLKKHGFPLQTSWVPLRRLQPDRQ